MKLGLDKQRIAGERTRLLFVAIALCFLLPFGTVSCDGSVTVRGSDLVAGHAPPVHFPPGTNVQTREDNADFGHEVVETGQPWAILALLIVVAGVFVPKRASGWRMALGIFSLLALLRLGILPAENMADVTYREGFLLALVLTLAATVFAWRDRRAFRRALAASGQAVPSPRERVGSTGSPPSWSR